MMAFTLHSIFARVNRSDGVSDSNPVPYHSPIEYRLRIFGFFGFAMCPEHIAQSVDYGSLKEFEDQNSWLGGTPTNDAYSCGSCLSDVGFKTSSASGGCAAFLTFPGRA